MVKERNLEGEIVYMCEKCGWFYRDREMANKCESWCKKHRACNLKYYKFAIKINEMGRIK